MKYILIILLALCIGNINAAELPEKGLDPPAVIFGPGDRPDNPLPVGDGLAVVAGFVVLYAFKKKSSKK